MILFNDALNIVLNTNVQMGIESVDLHAAIGRVLSKNIISDINMPPFDKAAMDGFAICESDINNQLTIIETVAAGQTPTKKVKKGEATRIMTGAPVPEGADFVIQVELSEMADTEKVRFTGHPKNNIIALAEDIKTGDTVLKKGQKIDARHIAVLASVGITKPMVYKQPKIGIISTGNELVEPQNKPGLSQIRNSNGHQLVAQALQCNALVEYFGIVEDNHKKTYNVIKKGVDTCDILLLTGGVSMGDFDFVPKIMTDLGINILFDRVAVQPGKPTTFGKKGDKFIFGLPGNPVSSFVQFEIFVKPLLKKITNQQYKPDLVKLPLGADFKRRKSERKAFIPVKILDNSEVFTTEYHGSAHIYALPNANGLAVIEKGIKELKKGDLVDVRLF